MKTIELNAIDLDLERAQMSPASAAAEQHDEQETDDLENPVESAPAAAPAEPPSIFFPITINPEDVREFYPRKRGRVGTRIVYKNGAARPVKELYAEVVAKFASLNN